MPIGPPAWSAESYTNSGAKNSAAPKLPHPDKLRQRKSGRVT